MGGGLKCTVLGCDGTGVRLSKIQAYQHLMELGFWDRKLSQVSLMRSVVRGLENTLSHHGAGVPGSLKKEHGTCDGAPGEGTVGLKYSA